MTSRRRPAPASPAVLAAAFAALVAGAACDNVDLAAGDPNDIYFVSDPELWAAVEDTVDAALQPTILTVTRERTFTVVPVDPSSAEWGRVRRSKQLLLVGTREDPWVSDALAARQGDPVEAPAVVGVNDVWARNQTTTVLLLESDDPATVVERLPELRDRYDEMFRRMALERMFVSGRDSALADSLARQVGFTLMLPTVYDWDHRDSLYIFRNDNPSPDELIRQLMVTWRTPLPFDLESVMGRESLLEWRAEAIGQTLTIPQEVDTSLVRAAPIEHRGHRAFELQAVWQNPVDSGWPAAGPFVTRVIACEDQNRLYLLDAWLYAPGRDKYEYMIQLETIMDSFRCDS